MDIDLNLIGAATRPGLDEVRPRIEAGLEAAFASQELDARRRRERDDG